MAVELFPPEESTRLGGPDWLRDRRRHAVEALRLAELPTVELEEWRYSRIGDLRPERFSLLGAADVAHTPAEDRVPVVAAAMIAALGELKIDPMPIADVVRYRKQASELVDKVGFDN